MPNLLAALREKTKDTHSSLHKNPVLKRCQEEQLDLSTYNQMLLAFYQPWKKLIPKVEQVPINNLKPLLVQRHRLLHNDLTALNTGEENLVLDNTESFTHGELLGMCYVVIGSSMGATLLSQNAQATLGLQPTSYLSMSPKDAGWPILSAFLREKESKDYPKATESASEAFRLIETHLSDVAL